MLLLAAVTSVSLPPIGWVVLAVVLLILMWWAADTYLNIDRDIKYLLYVVVVFAFLIWSLNTLGVLHTVLAHVVLVLLGVGVGLAAFEAYVPVRDANHPRGMDFKLKRAVHWIVLALAIVFVLYSFNVLGIARS